MALNFSEKGMEEYLTQDISDEEYSALEEEVLADYDPVQALEAHRDDMIGFKYALEELMVIKREYDPEKHALQALEEGYLRAMLYAYNLARRFNPLSTYGRSMIKSAEELKDDYEEQCSPLIMELDSANADAFGDFMSEDILEAVQIGDLKGFGVLRTDFNDTYPAGVCIWNKIEIPEDEKPIIDVRWIFVHPGMRKRGIANQIMGELVSIMIREGAGSMALSFIPTENYEIIMQYLLEWKFEFDTSITEDFRCRISDLKDQTVYEKAATGVTPLSELDETVREELIEGYAGKNNLTVLSERYEAGYFDDNLSFFIGDKGNVSGLLLTHKKPSGDFGVEYLDWGNEIDIAKRLLSKLFAALISEYDKDAMVTVYPDSEEMEDLLDEMSPRQLVAPCVEAILLPPGDYDDVTEEDVVAVLAELK